MKTVLKGAHHQLETFSCHHCRGAELILNILHHYFIQRLPLFENYFYV